MTAGNDRRADRARIGMLKDTNTSEQVFVSMGVFYLTLIKLINTGICDSGTDPVP